MRLLSSLTGHCPLWVGSNQPRKRVDVLTHFFSVWSIFFSTNTANFRSCLEKFFGRFPRHLWGTESDCGASTLSMAGTFS